MSKFRRRLGTPGAVQAWMNASGTSVIIRAERLPGSNCDVQSTHGGGSSGTSDGGSGGGNSVTPSPSSSSSSAAAAALPLFDLRHHVDAAIGLPTTVHVYANVRPGSQTLELHADHSDVLVVQVNGTKVWEVCAPTSLPPAATGHEGNAEQRRGDDGGLLAAAYQLHLKSRWDDHAHTTIAEVKKRKVQQQQKPGPSTSVPAQISYVAIGGGGIAGETAMGPATRLWTYGR